MDRHWKASRAALYLAAGLTLGLGSLTARPGAAETSQPADASMAGTIKDSTGRVVTLPASIERVTPAGSPAQVLLHVIAPSKLAGLVEAFKPEHVIYVDPSVARLPQIPMLTRTDAPGDLAMVQALKPGLSVDYGNVSARYAAADEKIGQELRVPSLLFDGSLEKAADVVTVLGKALGTSERAATVAEALRSNLAALSPLSTLPDDQRVPVYLSRGGDGLNAARAGTSFDEAIRLAGGRNVVSGTGPTFKRMSVADVVAAKPAIVIVDDRDALASPLRAALPKSTVFVLDTGEPYPVLTGAPSLNRLVGVVALAAILHPGKVKTPEPTVLESTLFPVPPGLALPQPLQVQH